MFVNSEDLATFTGLKRPAAQARVLRARRIKFTIDRLTGVPQVTPAVIERYKAREAEKVAELQERIAEAEEHSCTAAQSARSSALFVSVEQLVELTGKVRPAAQAKWLEVSGLKFMRRGDGSVALRLAELDEHTLSAPAAATASKANVLPKPQLQD